MLKRVLLAALVGAVFAVTIGQGVAGAFPAAPRAKASVAASSAAAPGTCLNIDRDFRFLCLGGATPDTSNPCRTIASVPGVIAYYDCGDRNPAPPGPGCENIDHDNNMVCFGGATPGPGNGTCKSNLGVPGVVQYYRCSGGSFAQTVRRIIRRVLP